MESKLHGYTAKELLTKAFNQLTPKNWQTGPENKFNYFNEDKTQACIVGRCALITGNTKRNQGTGPGTIFELEGFLSDSGIDVATLTFENDRAYSLETFKQFLIGTGWLKKN